MLTPTLGGIAAILTTVLTVAVANGFQTSDSHLPELVLHSGHNSNIRSLQFSPDGALLASASDDSSVKLWDVASGRELRTLRGHASLVLAVAFSPDGAMLASGGSEGTVPLWNVANGQRIRTLTGPTELVSSLEFSRDGRWLVAACWDKTVRVWETTSGTLKVTLRHAENQNSAAISPDGRVVISGGYDQKLTVWNVASAQPIGTVGADDTVWRVAMSPDGKLAAASTGHTVTLCDLTSLKKLVSFPVAANDGFLAFSKDGERLAFGRTEVHLLNIATQKETDWLTLPGDQLLVGTLSADWQWASWGGFDNTVHIRNIAKKIDLPTANVNIGAVRSARLSPDGRWIATGGVDKAITLWDLATGEVAASIPQTDLVSNLAFSRDGRVLASSLGIGGTVQLWGIPSFTPAGVLPTKENSRLAFGKDGLLATSGFSSFQIQLWDTETKKLRRTINTRHSQGVTALGFSPDGSLIGSGGAGGIQIWAANTGALVQTIPAKVAEMNGMAFSPDNKRVASGLGVAGRTAKIWDVATGTELASMTSPAGSVDEVLFTPDATQLITGGQNSIRVWDSRNARLIRTVGSHPGGVNSIDLTSDVKLLVSSGQDGTTRIWDARSSNALLLSLASLPDQAGWVAYTPDGLFDGSAEAMPRFGWRVGNRAVTSPLDSFFADFFYPGILAEVMARNRPKAQIDITTAIQLPGLGTMLKQKLARILTRDGTVSLCFDQPPTAVVPELLISGRDAAVQAHGFIVSPNDPECKYRRPLEFSGNQRDIQTRLENWKPESFTSEWDGKNSLVGTATLHVVTIGIGAYPKDSGLEPLQFSVAAARQIERFFSSQAANQKKTFGQVRVWPGLYDGAATRRAIRQRLADLARATKEDDVVFLYFSGHGVVPRGEEMFGFMPVDGHSDTLEQQRDTSLNTAMLAEAVRDLPARRVALVIDACQSGGALEPLEKVAEVKLKAEQRRAEIEKRGAETHAHESGVHILAAATPLQFAVLSPRLRGSALATALLESLEMHRSSAVTIQDLIAEVQKRLPEISNQTAGFTQTPMVSSLGVNFPIATY